MNDILSSISEILENICWEMEGGKKKNAIDFTDQIKDIWPLASKLRDMMAKVDNQERSVGLHVRAVIASINDLLPDNFDPTKFFVASNTRDFNIHTYQLAWEAYNTCWGASNTQPIFGNDLTFAKAFLRAAALYHDIGKLISDDHHVSRGVHLMRDVSHNDRRSIENLFDDLWDRRNFWSILQHHDVFGCLCTGESSLPALADIVGWSSSYDIKDANIKSTIAKISMLNWLNIADSNAALVNIFGGITTVEARRYLSDWKELKEYLNGDNQLSGPVSREEFKSWALGISSKPERAIRRITRLIATCYRIATGSISPEKETEIQCLVEEELQALHGPRFERFCYRFARFCKFDYGLRFFCLLMRFAFQDEGITEDSNKSKDTVPAEQKALRNMISRTCSILHRIVEEYGHLVDGDSRTCPRLGVDMSNLMNPHATGEAICNSLKETPSGALWWIIDEIGVWLYGD